MAVAISSPRPRASASAPQTLAQFLPQVTKPAFEKFGFSLATLITDWEAIVGADFAAVCRPEKLAWPNVERRHGEAAAQRSGNPGAAANTPGETDDPRVAGMHPATDRAGDAMLSTLMGGQRKAGPRAWAQRRTQGGAHVVGVSHHAVAAAQSGSTARQSSPGQPAGARLTVRVASASALIIQHRSDQLLERVNVLFGYRAVTSLRIIQGPLERAAAPAGRTDRVARLAGAAHRGAGRQALGAQLAPHDSHDDGDGLDAALARWERRVAVQTPETGRS
ncbi:MAG: hypothetical protein AAFO79_05855 [Pseudomonadota bacterium]